MRRTSPPVAMISWRMRSSRRAWGRMRVWRQKALSSGIPKGQRDEAPVLRRGGGLPPPPPRRHPHPGRGLLHPHSVRGHRGQQPGQRRIPTPGPARRLRHRRPDDRGPRGPADGPRRPDERDDLQPRLGGSGGGPGRIAHRLRGVPDDPGLLRRRRPAGGAPVAGVDRHQRHGQGRRLGRAPGGAERCRRGSRRGPAPGGPGSHRYGRPGGAGGRCDRLPRRPACHALCLCLRHPHADLRAGDADALRRRPPPPPPPRRRPSRRRTLW